MKAVAMDWMYKSKFLPVTFYNIKLILYHVKNFDNV